MRTTILKIIALTLVVLPGLAFGNEQRKPVIYRFMDRPFMELLGYMEGPDGYDDITGFTKRRPVKPITRMTINEVLDFQMMLRQDGADSSAVGRYQYIYKTLDYVTDKHDIDRNQLFDKEMQDRLARIELERCGFYDPHIEIGELGDCLAHVWAALPLLTGKNRGKSKYVATGINSARTSPEIVEALLKSRFYTREIGGDAPRAKSSGLTITSSSFPG
jgi:hypothetical protein